MRFLASVIQRDPIPRSRLYELGGTFSMNPDVLDEAANHLGATKTFENGDELWSFPP